MGFKGAYYISHYVCPCSHIVKDTVDVSRSAPVTIPSSPYLTTTRDASARYRLPDINNWQYRDFPTVSLRHPASSSSTITDLDDPDRLCGGERIGSYCYHKCYVPSWPGEAGIPAVVEMSDFASDKRRMASPQQFPALRPSIMRGASYTSMPYISALRRSSSIWMPRCGLWDRELGRHSHIDTTWNRALEEGCYKSHKPFDPRASDNGIDVANNTTTNSSVIRALARRWMGTTLFERRYGQLPIRRAEESPDEVCGLLQRLRSHWSIPSSPRAR